MVPATAARSSARLSFCLTPVSILLLIASSWCIALAGEAGEAPEAELLSDAQHSSRYPRSAAQRFLQLISGYDTADDDDRSLRSLFSLPSSRRERIRVSGVPVLLLPVAVQDEREFDEYTVRPSRRRTSTEYDSGEEDERPPRRGPGARRPPAAAERAEAPAVVRPAQRSPYGEPEFPVYRDKPSVIPVESSQRLVEMFRSQAPTGDTAPPAIVQSEFDSSERVLLPDDDELDEDEWAPSARTRRALLPTLQRGGDVAQRAGDVAQRGGDAAQRGGDVAQRGGDAVQRGGDVVQRAGDVSQRGGDAVQRGGDVVQRAGDVAQRGGEAVQRRGDAAHRGGDVAQRAGDAVQRGRSGPTRPRLAHPLKLRAVLTVPRADYSETYTAWWDPNSGDSRVHFQDGSTVTFRKMLPNGLVQKVEMHVDRASGRTLRRCATSVSVAGAADRLNPALPDLQLFTFAGYADGAERWEYRAEEAARGEALAARHELLLLRDRDDSALPLRYSVAVNSSLLGADCDGYRHDYLDARYHNRGPDFFRADLDELCDEVRQLNASSAEALARLEPLREFTLPRRDPRYEAVLERFKTENGRQYVDDVEEAVRKNVVMQSSRFSSSGNRAGATFQLGLNFLADRLDAELQGLRGVAHDSERSRAERFPHPRRALASLEPRLPAAFDWRAQGGVTPVRYQGSCSSCWAFATAGAVEGALFRSSGRLTPLSEQQLVDCAHAFGGNGCKGTWPSRAYDYIQARGLAALGDYTPYSAKVESCQEESVAAVTRISGHVNVTKYSVPALKVAIKQHGPAVVIVDSSPKSFTLYSKGVLYDDRCSKKSAKHAVLAVGWGQEKGEPYFILKNSWSEVWGERGYIRVQARANTCGVLTHPSYPRLDPADVLQN